MAICFAATARQSIRERISSESGRPSPAPIATKIHVGRAAIDAKVRTGETKTPISRRSADSRPTPGDGERSAAASVIRQPATANPRARD